MTYDKNNIFAKILRGEIPCKKIYEDEYVLAFHDINPQKKVHALVIPKGEYVNLDDFSSKASEKEIVGLIKGIGTVAKKLGVSEVVKGKGYRSLVNVGENGGQEVPHLHFHIFGGERVGKMIFDKNSLELKGWETNDAYSNKVNFEINNLIINNQILDDFFKIPQEKDL